MNQLLIGWASRDVSTDKPVNIPGQFHMRISEGILDPVTVTALVIDNGEDLACFLSADLVVVRSGLLDEVRAKTAKLLPGFPVLKIIMNATHTHAAPSHYADGSWGKTAGGTSTPLKNEVPVEMEIASGDEYRDFLSTQSAEAIAEAYRSRTRGGVAWGYGYAVVAHSRRVTYSDDLSQRPGAIKNSTHGLNGHSAMYGNTNDPNFLGYEAGADHFINLLYTFDSENRLTGAIVNVPCPSQCSEGIYKLSASYWHETREAIRKKHPGVHIIAQAGASGDLSPRILHYKKAQERRFSLKYGRERLFAEEFERRDIAERIYEAFEEVLSWAKKDIRTELPIKHIVTTASLTKRLITKEEYEADKAMLAELMTKPFKTDGTPNENLRHNSVLVASRNRCKRIIDRYEKLDAEPKLPMELHALRIGDIAFATNRFELYMDFMHRIQARSPFEQTFVVQLCGVPGMDGGTYLPTERGEWGRGYSASKYCNIVSSKGGQELVEQTLELLNQIADPKPADGSR
ncbi:MAG TPA: hypothetical protein PLH67_14700 [Lentisphaeria bacterium]|nr:hypothetical protein [Lentisphaeria bacterium]